MNSLVAYGSDEENDDRYDQVPGRGGARTGGACREDDTNYDDVTMDMSEDSNNNESDRELPPTDDSGPVRRDRRHSPHRNDRKERSSSPRRDRRPGEKERSSSPRRDRRPGEKERSSSPRRDRRHSEKERDRHGRDGDRHNRDTNREHRDDRRAERGRYPASSGRRGLLGDKPDDRNNAEAKVVPALMDLKPFGGESPSSLPKLADLRDSRESTSSLHKLSDSRDARDARASERERREHERERERHRDSHKDRDRHGRRTPDRKHRRTRSRSRDRCTSRDRRSPRDRSHDKPSLEPLPPHRSGASISGGEYRPSYKVSKKLQVMEKMGLQIKRPDGSMTTAQQLMQQSYSAGGAGAVGAGAATGGASYFKPGAVAASLVAQVERRKLLWSKKGGGGGGCEAEAESSSPKPLPESAAKWTGTKFAQDTDGKVANKFMRLMGIKQPEMVSAPCESDVNEKQERMFQDMQAQYEVARATTHTMRGVGLGFQRHL